MSPWRLATGRLTRRLPVAALLLLAGAWPAFAQVPGSERRTVAAVRLGDEERITLDGRLDEDVWRRAIPATDFVQIDPLNGRPATEPTEVRIAYNSRSFYMGVICFDSEPDKWIGYQRRRDEFLGSDDRFQWTIDTFLDARSGYFFEMNPSGLMADSLMGNGIDNRQWDGIWNARVQHSDIGWTIEIDIPFRTLNFNPDHDSWGINFQRTVRRKNEDSIWMGWARNQGLRRMTNAGLVTGITNVTQGIGLDMKPYGLAVGEAFPGRGQPGMSANTNAGVDLFYSLTPSLRSVLTINTDFAQTEVDQRQVNLTRFSLFFPERREFFLDGAPFFAFGSPASGDLIINPFFSRRIGLTSAGTPQPINYGARLTGQAGRQDLGMLHVRTAVDQATPSEEFTVGRLRRRMLQQSYIGGIYTRRAPHEQAATARHTVGMDYRFGTNNFRGGQNLETTGYFMHATNADASGGSSYGMTVAMPNDRWNMSFNSNHVEPTFEPAIGFVTRRGYRRYQPSIEFGPRPRGHRYIRRFLFSTALDVQTSMNNQILNRSIQLKPFEIQLHSQDNFSVLLFRNHERLDTAFTPRAGITLPVGSEYDTAYVSVRAQTANRRVVAVNSTFENGGYYSGTRRMVSLNLTLRARPGFIVYTTTEWNRIHLAEGRFETRLFRVIGEAQFSPWVSVVNNLQYDSVSRVLGWQSRFRWIMRPGSDIFVVYTHNWLDDPNLARFATLDRRIASKVLFTHRF